jgi:hypothetical protein
VRFTPRGKQNEMDVKVSGGVLANNAKGLFHVL